MENNTITEIYRKLPFTLLVENECPNRSVGKEK